MIVLLRVVMMNLLLVLRVFRVGNIYGFGVLVDFIMLLNNYCLLSLGRGGIFFGKVGFLVCWVW